MAKVIRFPVIFREVIEQNADDDGMRQQCLAALKMLFEDMRSGKVEPTKMFIVYGDNKTGSWSYLNLGFGPDQLVRAIDLVLEDQNIGMDK
jgi:hypothetical protein